MSEQRLFIAYIGLVIVAMSIGALLGAAAGREAHLATMEIRP